MLQPKKPSALDRKLQEINSKPQSTYSIESQGASVGLDNEEVNSFDTRHGNVTAPVLSEFISTADKHAMEYQNSAAKEEIDLMHKKELEDATKAIEDVDKTIKDLQTNKDNYQEFTNPLDTQSAIGPKAVLGTKALKPEVQQQIDEAKARKIELAKGFDNHPELQAVNDKIKTLEDKYTFKGASTDTKFFDNPLQFNDEMWENLTAKVANTFSNPEKKMTSQEKGEYTKLKAQRDIFYKPIAEEKIRQRDEDATNLRAKLYQVSQDGENRSVGDKLRLLTAARKAELNKRELEAYVNDEDGSDAFFRKLSLYTVSSKGGGMEDMVQNISDYAFKDELQNKADKVGYANLTKEEQDILYTYSTTDEDKQFLADKQKWSYNTVDQTAHSIGFIRDIIIADALTGGILAAVLPEGSAALSAGKLAMKAGGSARKAKNWYELAGIAANVTEAVGKTAKLATSIAIENHLNPEYLNNELMKGSYIDRDAKGQVKNIFVKENYHKMMVNAYKDDFVNFENTERTLEAKENLTKEEEEQLRYAKVKLGKINDIGEHSLQEELDLFKPLSGMDAELKGFGKMASERVAEIYTEPVLGFLGKSLTKVPGIGKYVTKAETALNNVNSSFKATKVGRLYNSMTTATRRVVNDGAGNPIINSLPSEIAEEYVTAGMNSAQDRDLKELHDMFDVQANVDIGAQTLLMTSMFGISGNVQTNSKLMLNKLANSRIKEAQNKVNSLKGDDTEEGKAAYQAAQSNLETLQKSPYIGSSIIKVITGSSDASFQGTRNYVDARKSVRNSIAQLKSATTDEEVKRVVNMMTTSGFGISNVQAKIAALKAKGKTEEAKVLETTMFQKLVFDSFKGGVQDELKSALGKLQKNTNVSIETKERALKAEQNLEQLNKVYTKYADKPNIAAITNFAFEKTLLKQGIDEVTQQQSDLSDSVLEEIKAYITSTNQPINANDVSMSTLFTRQFEDTNKQKQYNEFLDNLLSTNNTAIENYAGLEHAKYTLSEQLANSTVAFNEAVTPSQETLNKENFLKTLQEAYDSVETGDGKVASTKAKFNYNNQLEQTTELIDELFDGLEKDAVGKTMDGKISKDAFEKLRTKFKDRIEDRNKLETLKALLKEQSNINNKRTEEKEDEIEVPPTTITVLDNDAEEQFEEALIVDVSDVSSIFDDESLPDPDTSPIRDAEFDLQIDNNYTSEQLKAITSFVNKTVESIENKLGRKITFREFMEQTYKYTPDKNQVRKIFNPSIAGWKANNYEADNYQQVFNDLFVESDITAYVEAITNIFESEVSVNVETPYTELDNKTNDIQEQVAKTESVTTTYDEENLPVVKTLVDDIESQRTLNIQPKLGFSALTYDEVIENGVLKRVTRGSVLNISPDSLIDFRDLLNPEMYKTGDKLQLETANESLWSTITVSDGRDANGDVKTTDFASWLASREKNNPQFRTSQEFLNKVPIFYTSSAGKRLAYIQDTDWYNPFNVGNPYGENKDPNTPSQEWLNHIEQGKNNTQNLRNNIAKGLKEVIINKPEDGKFHKVPLEEPLITLNESNPQTIIAVQRGTTLNTSFTNEFKDGILLNTNSQNEKGFDNDTNSHTWMINRIGFTTNDKGEVVPSYRAYPVMRLVNNSQIETARWALAAHLTLKGDTWTEDLNADRNKGYKLTVEQAKKIQKDINANMGFNIENPKEIINFLKTYFQTKVSSDALSSYRTALFQAKEPKDSLLQHTRLASLNNKNIKSVVHIEQGVVTLLNMKYEDYLKNTLMTNIKSFDVGTASKPMYATVIQPIINVDYTEVQEQVSPRQEAVNQVIEELKAVVEETAPFNLSKHKLFLNQIGVDLDSFEDSDAMIENTDKLANIFKLTGNLNILQEKAVRQFIVHSIGEKTSFDYKALSNPAKIKAETLSELKLIINPLVPKIETMLAEVKTQEGNYSTLIDAYETTLKNIKDIQNNFSVIYEKGWKDIQKQTSLTLNEDSNDNKEDDDVTLFVKDYNKDSIEESSKSKASYRLRRFLYKIPVYDTKGNAQNTYLGLPKYMSFNEVYNELSKILAMGNEVVSDYDAIINKLKESKSPFVKDVLNKLAQADQQIKNEFVYNFVRHSLSSKFAMFEVGNSGTSLKIYDTNSNEATRVIRNTWLNEYKSSNIFDLHGKFNSDYAQALVNQFDNWDKDYRKVPQDELRTWLSNLGFVFDDGAWKQIYDNGIWNSQKQNNFNALYTQAAGGLFMPLVKYLKDGIAKPSEHNYDNKKNIFTSLRGVTNALSLVEAQYNANLIALSFRDSGKNISTQVPTKYITDMVQELKRSVNDDTSGLITDLQSLSFSSDSVTLQLLKENPEFKRLFEISHLSLTAIKKRGDNPSKAGITDLSDIDYDLVTLTGFLDRKGVQFGSDNKINGITLRMAHMMFPTMSDKTTGLFLRTSVFDFLADSSLLFERQEDGVVTGLGDQTKDLLFNQLVLPELKRIINFHQKVKATNIKNYDNGAMLFHFIPALNTIKDEQGLSLVEKLATLENYTLEDIIEQYGSVIKDVIEKTVKSEVEHKMQQWSSYMDDKKGSSMFDTNYFTEVKKSPVKDYELGVYDYVMNTMLHNAEVFKVFAGDIANYSQDKLYKEEGKKVLPYQIKDASTYISLNKEIGVNLGKRLALLIAPGNKIANSYNEEYNQIFLEDAIDISENAAYLVKNYYGQDISKEIERYRKAADLIDRHEQGNVFLNPDRYNSIKDVMLNIRKDLAKRFPDLEGYFDIESTDAQEYSTAYEHISLLHRMGKINDKEFNTITNKLLSGQELTKDGPNSELNLVFQPIKPVQTGAYINKDFDVNQIIYIKSSSFPLIPQLTAGTKLDNLRKKMEELESSTGRFTRASFQTANKVGGTKNAVNPFDVNALVSVKEYEPNDISSVVRVLNRNNFRIQQDVPFKSDKKVVDTVSMGTQFFKLLFGDGMMNIDDFRLNGNLTTGKQLYEHYNKNFATIVNNKKQELFMDLGLDSNGNVQSEAKFIKSLQNLLIDEATKRGYSIKSLAGLKIEQLAAKAGVYYEFKTPLWLSSDSNRYESLLNAIITNRLMKHKMPGNGFVAGSESGFKFQESLKGIDKSRIIYLDGWNGKELQGTHDTDNEGNVSFHTAQAFAPSKFKNSKNELVDLFENFNGTEGKYIIRKENGSLGLKDGIIDKELLNLFTFRTPTSSHVSGSSVEIVGILPPESGDLMIVPKNFTKQKGLDYDIDKESAYALNHVTHKDGSITVLTKTMADDMLQSYQSIIEEFDLENTVAERKAQLISTLQNMATIGSNEEGIEELINPQASVEDKMKRMSLKLSTALAQNEFIRTHLAVFNNSNPIVQNKINKILSIDFAKKQASEIEKLEAEGEKNKTVAKYIKQGLSPLEAEKKYQSEAMNFTMLTYSYQKNKMSLGSIGKVAIGVYANYTTFNGLLQQNDADVFIKDEQGEPASLQIGRFTSNGILGNEKTLDGERTTAEVFAEKENTATDNEKEQVLGRVGVNEFTINVDAHMTLRGFDKDENGNSISYLLLSQPIIKELNERRKENKGILGQYIKDDDILAELVDKYSKGVLKYIPSTKEKAGPFEGSIIDTQVVVQGIQGNLVSENFIKDPQYGGSLLQGNAMLDGIKYNGDNRIVQFAALKAYLNLEKEAKAVSNVQKTINTNTLGKSMIESQLKYENLKTLPDNTIVAGADKLLGDFSKEQNNKIGGQWIGKYYVTPTTPQGQIAINGLHLGNNLYKDFFPYQDESILKVVKEIIAAKGREEIADSTVIDNFETIVEGIRKYIYSRQDNNIFNVSPKAKRYELFKDDVNNISLSTYLKDVLKSEDEGFKKGIKLLKQNTLIKSFTFDTGRSEEEISTIKYNNAQTDNLDEEDLYNSIPELVVMNAPLPSKNGQPYTTKALAEDLVAYSFLEGGVQEATQFIKYVPVEFLESIGQKENGVFVPANRKLQVFNTVLQKNADRNIFGIALGIKEDETSTFTKQYFQHNPTSAARISFKDKKNQKDGTFTYMNSDSKSPSFVSMKNKKEDKKKFSLYQNIGNSVYQEIDTLGNFGISEYDYRNEGVSSLMAKTTTVTQSLPAKEATNLPISEFTVNEKTTIKSLLNQVANYDNFPPEYAHLKEAAKWLEPIAKNKGNLVLDNTIQGAGLAMRQSLDIKLNPSLTLNESDEKTALVFIHEFIHTISVAELQQYYESDGITLKSGTVPSYVTNLNAVFNYFVKQHKTEIDALKAKMNDVKNNPDSPVGVNYTDREKSLIYAGTNVFEFVTMSLSSPLFQEEMSKMQYASTDKSILDKIKELLMSLIESIYPNITKGSVAEASIIASMDFINEESSKRRSIEQQENLPPDVQLELDKEDATMLQYQSLPSPDEIQDVNLPDPDLQENNGSETVDLMIDNLENLPNFEPC